MLSTEAVAFLDRIADYPEVPTAMPDAAAVLLGPPCRCSVGGSSASASIRRSSCSSSCGSARPTRTTRSCAVEASEDDDDEVGTWPASMRRAQVRAMAAPPMPLPAAARRARCARCRWTPPAILPAVELTPDEFAESLGAAELEVVGRMRYSSNATFLVEAKVDGDELPAIYKPRRGERPLWDFPEARCATARWRPTSCPPPSAGTSCPSSCATARSAGAVQRFVEHDPDEHYFTLLEGREDRFRQFAVFDVLANNTDRKGGHCLYDEANDMIVGIDHGLVPSAWKLRTVIWDFAGEPVPGIIGDDVCRTLDDLRGGLGQQLDHLTPVEIEAIEYCGRALLAQGFPYPDDCRRRWPLV